MSATARIFIVVAIVFAIEEGFYLLPTSVVAFFPGLFRLSDTLIIFVALAFFLYFNRWPKIFKESTQASLIILAGCVLTVVTAAAAMFWFDQPFGEGLLFVRHNFNYLLFFVFLALLRSVEDINKLINVMMGFIAVMIVLSIIQKLAPTAAIFTFPSLKAQYMDIKFTRLGEHRLLFPYLSFSALFYFLVLAQLLYADKTPRWGAKVFFILFFAYALIGTLTRVNIISITLVTVAAFFTCRKRMLKAAGIIIVILAITAQMLSLAVSEKGVSSLEENRLAKIISFSMNIKEGSIQGRFFQNEMYLNNFMKSPIVGVGTIKYNENRHATFKKYGIFYNNDLGYIKLLTEYGLLGLLWVLWFYVYVYKRTKIILQDERTEQTVAWAKVICRGVRLFFIYIAVSMLTLPHFIEGDRILPLVLGLVFIEIAHRSVKERTAPGVVSA